MRSALNRSKKPIWTPAVKSSVLFKGFSACYITIILFCSSAAWCDFNPRGGGHWVCQLTVCEAKKLAFKIASLQCSKKSVKFIALQCIFLKFSTLLEEKTRLFKQKFLVFPKLTTLTVHLTKVHPYSASLLS